MSLPTPEQLAQLAKLKAEFKAKAEIENRKAKAIANAERLSGKPVVLPTDRKAKGGSIHAQLRKHGKSVSSELEAMRRMSEGHRVFVVHELDETPREVKSVRELAAFTPDQIYTLAPITKATGGSIPSQDVMRLAIGGGPDQSPFYSAADKAAQELKRGKGTGAEFLTELTKTKGVKPAEVEHRKLGEIGQMPKMTKEQFMAEMGKRPTVQITEKIKGDPYEGELTEKVNKLIEKKARKYAYDAATSAEEEKYFYETEKQRLKNKEFFNLAAKVGLMDREANGDPKYQKWSLPDADGYREILYTLPSSRPSVKNMGRDEYNRAIAEADAKGLQDYHSSHWEEPNVLAHARVSDRSDRNSNSMHIEEIQSDWHQAGRKKGYKSDVNPQENAALVKQWDTLAGERRDLERIVANGDDADPAVQNAVQRLVEVSKELNLVNDKLTQVRTAFREGVPDAPFKKNWHEMVLNSLLHRAAKENVDHILITPGAEQAERYNLSKHIDEVEWNPEKGRLYVKKKGGTDFDKVADDVTNENLANYIGVDAAQRLLAQPFSGSYKNLKGIDLQIGGEGMKGFYDKIIPDYLNKLGKKHGVQVEMHAHPIAKGKPHPDDQLLSDLGVKPQQATHVMTHRFKLTPEMKKEILANKFPLYQTGGVVHKAQGGAVQPTIPQMKMALLRSNPAAIQSLGANEAPDMSPKTYIPPAQQTGKFIPPGGVDMNPQQPGQQLMPQQPMQQPPQQQPQAPEGMAPQQPDGSNILQMTPQGRAMSAMQPQQPQGMADGGSIKISKTSPRTWAGTGFGYSGATYGIQSHPHIAIKREAHGWTAIDTKDRSKKWFGTDKTELEQELAKDLLKPQGMADGGQPEDDYRGSHQAPGPHFGAPMHDVTRDIYPKDFYGPNGFRYYADHGEHHDREAYDKVRFFKDKPDGKVFIHRAIPTSVYKEALKKHIPIRHMIRPGDWVAISKQYAKDHGESVLKGDYKIASMRVPAKHVWTNGDSIHEWGYHPVEEKAKGGKVSQDGMRLALTMKKAK